MRLGLLAASRIAEAAVVSPARELDRIELVAVAARDRDRAEQAAQRWEIPQAFGSYEEMLGSGQLDAVYIGTPAALHRPWVERALAHDLHVLCEKPFASNADDAHRAMAAARESDRVVMEAFHWRYHPLVAQMQAVLDRLGPVRRVEAWFDVEEGRIPPDDIRWDFRLGGGSTMDLGCYCIAWVRWAVGAEPTVVAARAEATPDGVDASLEADLRWSDGAVGTIRSSMAAPRRGSGLVVEADLGV
ncbi:MAG: Gfo/Idh/MocA family oxidoreductase, partial [Acidimicrobiia bacterium]|nr:Gfo/Idh/MocA family oxidoreductase [Acidimicrobiia bacterium]